jgi:hypothetical protein
MREPGWPRTFSRKTCFSSGTLIATLCGGFAEGCAYNEGVSCSGANCPTLLICINRTQVERSRLHMVLFRRCGTCQSSRQQEKASCFAMPQLLLPRSFLSQQAWFPMRRLLAEAAAEASTQVALAWATSAVPIVAVPTVAAPVVTLTCRIRSRGTRLRGRRRAGESTEVPPTAQPLLLRHLRQLGLPTVLRQRTANGGFTAVRSSRFKGACYGR